ncbi:DUF5994 family protein [Mycolicibacterium sp.]|uniref:DUF5994 family protein n=1 Tax=Mycolicibacterium sp. TaxID=2320850 RepID=UPI001A23525E|nr:DUF5994 family protein [Mycolicibacterium sp.]MBJ7337890.1 hypothetical protein [Mycolicibacterium sp.]
MQNHQRDDLGDTTGVARVKVTSGRLPSEHVDGAWWPRSNQLSAELPVLLSALSERLGTVVAVGYPRDGWRDVPPHVDIDGREVQLLCLTGGDRTTVILIGQDGHHLTLRVIAPETGSGAAQAVLAQIPDRPDGDAVEDGRATLPRSLGDVAEKLAQHEGRHDDKRAADIMRWCVEAASEFEDAPIQSFVPILVEHVVHDRMAETR